MARVFNFSAGPAALPEAVLEASARALVDFEGKGVGIAEVSHRGPEFNSVREEAEARCRSLLAISDDYEVLFLQGGATQQFTLIPMNFLKHKADYLVTGQWANKAAKAAKSFGDINIVASSEDHNYNYIPNEWNLSDDADYLHICSNNTIFGTRLSELPEHTCLIADMSSEIMSRHIDVSKFGMIYAGAQKNLGPSGVVLCIIRKDLLAAAHTHIPDIFNYSKHAAAESCLNTPPTFGIYILLEMFRWLEAQGGITAQEKINEAKAIELYNAIDGSNGYYTGTVQDKVNRSRMNITFTLPNEDLTKQFITEAAGENLVALKGYRTVGGIRASTYNAMSAQGVSKLVGFMNQFASANPA